MSKYLTYKELIDLSLKYYTYGGDCIYECWDERVFNEYVKEFGNITKADALKMFKNNFEIDNEYRAAARYFSGEDY
jgi:hypothetical protein